MTIKAAPKKKLWIWFIWLGVFYLVWAFLATHNWEAVTSHWPIALAMALGSYAAGSTPMGGGTIGFPVLVLFFDLPASLGRDFSFAVQSIGMVSASIFIFARRQPLAWAMLKGAVVGSLVGLPIGIFFIAPLISDLWIKVVFAVVWGSFGLLHVYRIGEVAGHTGMTDFSEYWDHRVGFVIGMVASTCFVSVTGVGIDMVLYAALVLLCRADLKIAIPTSVVIMAMSSLYGVVIKSVAGIWQSGVYENWLAAAPVVILGAPLGVFIVDYIGRKKTLIVVAVLCIGQFIWTCYAEQNSLGWGGIAVALVAVVLFLVVFEWLRAVGARLVDKNRQRIELERKHRREHPLQVSDNLP